MPPLSPVQALSRQRMGIPRILPALDDNEHMLIIHPALSHGYAATEILQRNRQGTTMKSEPAGFHRAMLEEIILSMEYSRLPGWLIFRGSIANRPPVT